MFEKSSAHILQLITNLGVGGAQRVFSDHSRLLADHFHVSEATFDLSEAATAFQSAKPTFSLGVTAGRSQAEKAKNLWLRARRLRRLNNERRVDVCISHMDGANWVNVLSGSRARKILVVHGTITHDMAVPRWIQRLRTKILIPWLYNRADVTVAVSNGIKRELATFCGVKNAISIPNFFDVAAIESQSVAPLQPLEETLFSRFDVLITSGRFHEQKRQSRLFPVFARVKNERPNVKLVFVGDGNLRTELAEAAQREGLKCFFGWDTALSFDESYDVYFLGFRNNPFPYLNRSALFLLPSGWEGFPMALGEAMIAGVPVLSSDCPTGPREILAPGTERFTYDLNAPEYAPYGVLLPTPDQKSFEDAWVHTILFLLGHPKKRQEMSEQARERMWTFDRSVIGDRWVSLIRNVQRMPPRGTEFDRQ